MHKKLVSVATGFGEGIYNKESPEIPRPLERR